MPFKPGQSGNKAGWNQYKRNPAGNINGKKISSIGTLQIVDYPKTNTIEDLQSSRHTQYPPLETSRFVVGLHTQPVEQETAQETEPE